VEIFKIQINESKSQLMKWIFRILIVSLLCFVSTALSIRNYSKHQSFEKADVAIVLGAGQTNGMVSNVFRERLNHSIQLYQSGQVNRIILTGGIGKNESVSDSEVALTYLLDKGIPRANVELETSSTMTYFNLVYAKKIMDLNQMQSALIVSDPYHMKRAIKITEKLGILAQPSPTQTSMYRSRKTKFKFLLQETVNYWSFLLVGQFRPI